MSNPFEKRATEYLRDDEAFLSVVTPAPLVTYFAPRAKDGVLFDRLVVVVGSPGSGKTTLATLLQFKTLETLRRNSGVANYKDLTHALTRCGLIKNEQILVCGCRLPLESEYREFWELPYEDEVKIGLMHSLLQSRAVISWIQNLTADNRHRIEDIEIVPRADLPAATQQIGGISAKAVFDRACQIEREIYKIGASLVPPKLSALSGISVEAYAPFQVIEKLKVLAGPDGAREYLPLAILDDAHDLHHVQLSKMLSWLARREQRVSRWVLMRLDGQTPQAALLDSFEEEAGSSAGPKLARDITSIWLQRNDDRRIQRVQFRSMAREMADRYLRLMGIFSRNGITSLASLLDSGPEQLTEAKLRDLGKKVSKIQLDLHIAPSTRQTLEHDIDSYCSGSENGDVGEDVRLLMLRILMQRYARRLPQVNLFELVGEQEPSRPVKANADVADGARIHLMHEYGRPYYFGMDALCDGSSENAELFLQLAGRLVALSETRMIRSQRPALPPGLQHRELRSKAQEMLDSWRFPERRLVRSLVDGIASQCLAKTLEPTAPLGAGPNAFGIPQEDFETIPAMYPRLAEVLKFGMGYNAINVKQKHGTKHALWALIELGGVSIIAAGLGFRKGNFVERTAKELAVMVGDAK